MFLDVDGTLTDGKVYMSATGELFKAFSIKDGYGLHDILIANGVIPVIITGRKSQILEKRCMELGITEVFQGITNKLDVLKQYLDDNRLLGIECAYIGDDLNDLDCINYIKEHGGMTACPNDAENEIKKIVSFVSKRNGGNGAVRDFINYLWGK